MEVRLRPWEIEIRVPAERFAGGGAASQAGEQLRRRGSGFAGWGRGLAGATSGIAERQSGRLATAVLGEVTRLTAALVALPAALVVRDRRRIPAKQPVAAGGLSRVASRALRGTSPESIAGANPNSSR